jgi:eukaryotic-like serine/threonine-protein kinase
MLITCSSCDRSLEFNGERPHFCAFCGKKLNKTTLARTDSYKPSPMVNGEDPNKTAVPPTNRIISFAGVGHRVPDRIGRYQIIRQLGSGGMGTVYEAEDRDHDRKVAIKLIKPNIAASTENLERFRQEGRLASLITHPRCVFVYHADEDQGRPYIVMELMPGATLKDIVSQQGPLQVGQAINKILDVIDGLQAAHQLGVIHRDVKPSNCFVLTDGHVKVGDFGLSKVLPTGAVSTGRTPELDETTDEIDEPITRTGVFVGTPLFASPEQIKGELVDFRTDVYSVSATLYFLLTGQAPFEGGDNTATIARIVSENPPSMQQLRPDLSPELDRVIMRGLERDRDSRWSNLADLRAALLQFQPGYLQNAPRSARIRAAIVDAALLFPLLMLLHQLMPLLFDPQTWGQELVDLATDFAIWLVILAYFLATEVMAGASFGKWLLHLKVGGLRPGRPPKRRQLLLRALGFFAIVALPGLLALALTNNSWIMWLFHGLGLLLLLDSMRAQGGFRGVHEILSRTCVVLVPVTQQPIQFPIVPPSPPSPLPPNIPTRIGNYAIDGIHRVMEDRIFLVGTDLILDRQVWLVMRPLDVGKIAPARREISRTSRLRWLGGGDVSLGNRSSKLTHHWDAFIAPSTGCSLTQMIADQGTLSWTTSRHLLLQLADELAIALTDDTFPDGLSLDQVWLQPDGQIMIVGSRFHETHPSSPDDEESDAVRSVQFLRRSAQMMLEGRLTPDTRRSIHAPIPFFDRPCIDRLMGMSDKPYTTPSEVAADLRKTGHRPSEVTAMTRLGQMLFYGVLLSPIVLAILVVGRYYAEIKPTLQLTHQVRRADRYLTWFADRENLTEFRAFMKQNPQEFRLINQATLFDYAASPAIGLISRDAPDRLRMSTCLGWIKKQRLKDLDRLNKLSNQLSMAAILPQLAAVEMLTTASKTSRETTPEELRLTLQHAISPIKPDEEILPLMQKLTPFQLAAITIGLWLLLWVLWSMLTRGGLSLKLMGIDLVNRRGRHAEGWRCAWRTLLIWAPFFALIMASVWLQDATKGLGPEGRPWWIYWIPWWLALIYLAGVGVIALLRPQRGLHDRLAGIYLIPR